MAPQTLTQHWNQPVTHNYLEIKSGPDTNQYYAGIPVTRVVYFKTNLDCVYVGRAWFIQI